MLTCLKILGDGNGNDSYTWESRYTLSVSHPYPVGDLLCSAIFEYTMLHIAPHHPANKLQ